MSDAIEFDSMTEAVQELGKVAVTEAAITAAEVAGALAVLAGVGFVWNKIQERRNKKVLASVSE